MKKRVMALILALLTLTALLSGCESKPAAPTPTATPAPVTLTIVAGWPDFRAIDVVAKLFTEKYPNVTIEYEYLQDFYNSLEKRLAGDGNIDLFLTNNIQPGSITQPYALNLLDQPDIDLSGAFDGLIQNFLYREPTEDGKQALYAVPLGAVMRGMYVNMTLLKSLNIDLPTDQASLLAACETLKQHGYIPFHGNPGNFAQILVYPWMCNLIANAEDPAATYAMIDSRQSGVSKLFEEPLSFLYTLVEKGYYDYKKAQTDFSLFLKTDDDSYARDFLNIRQSGEEYVKVDDVGVVAFLPSSISLQSVVDKVKDDYHSQIEYKFIPAPVGPDGGFVYLSPAHGIAAVKSSPNLEWAVKFLGFLFEPDVNKTFAEAFGVVPNVKDAFSYILSSFNTPDNRISHLGQVTFSYNFYDLVNVVLVDESKANNPKYMKDDGTGGLSMVTYDEFLAQLETALTTPPQ